MLHFLHLSLRGARRPNPQFLIDLSGVSIDDGNVEMLGKIQTERRLSNGCRSGDDYQRLFQQSVLSDNASLGVFDKRADIFYFLGIGELLTGHCNTVF